MLKGFIWRNSHIIGPNKSIIMYIYISERRKVANRTASNSDDLSPIYEKERSKNKLKLYKISRQEISTGKTACLLYPKYSGRSCETNSAGPIAEV